MTEQRDDPDTSESESGSGVQTGSAPQPLNFPGADQEPPGRPDGDQDPDPASDEPVD